MPQLPPKVPKRPNIGSTKTMATAEEAFQAQIAGKREQRHLSIRQVANGFLLSGQRVWLEPANNTAVMQLGAEAIATTSAAALESAKNFYETGVF